MPEPFRKEINVGCCVEVPLRNRFVKGYVLSLKEQATFPKTSPIKALLENEFALPEDLIELSQWMANYYCTPLFKILKLMIPSYVKEKIKKNQTFIVKRASSKKACREACIDKRTKCPKQAACLERMLKVQGAILLKDLLEQTKASKATLDALIKEKLLQIEEVNEEDKDLIGANFFRTKDKILSEEQQKTFDLIKKDIIYPNFQPHLIFGITGSGKTEIYLQAIKQARLLGKSVLFLVPEVSLTPQTIARLRARFEEPITVIHYKLSKGERFSHYQAMRKGEAKIVVGVRSAIFSPLKNLGLIIIDEEHESSYKQSESMPCYHAKEVGLIRAKILNCPIILGSATPSLESYKLGLDKVYALHSLTARAGTAEIAPIKIINMAHSFEKAKGFTPLSDAMIEAIKKRIDKGEQSLLFLNRRGYHTSFVCKLCGEALFCPHCSVTLTYHKRSEKLSCHLCGLSMTAITASCNACRSKSCFKYQGIGTEMVEKTLHALLPKVRTLRLDADTASKSGAMEETLRLFNAGKADVLIGTQMIAKGHHFPAVTLVGVLYLDSQLQIPDFRSQEQTFQLITQVAGRAGRATLKGEVLLQTLMPTHPLIEAMQTQNYPKFYNQEIASRKEYQYPPFSRIVKCFFSGKNEAAVKKFGDNVYHYVAQKLSNSFSIHPLSPSGYSKVRDLYRYQFFIRGPETKIITNILSEFLQNQKVPNHISFLIDVQPLSLF